MQERIVEQLQAAPNVRNISKAVKHKHSQSRYDLPHSVLHVLKKFLLYVILLDLLR